MKSEDNIKSRIVKSVALMLAVLTFGGTLLACGEKGEGKESESTTEIQQTAASTDNEEPASAWKTSNLPQRDYSGQTFVIRYATKTTFVPDTLNASKLEAGKDTIKKAGYERDRAFTEKTGAEISYIVSDTNPNSMSGSTSEIVSIRALNQSGELSEIDMMCVGARTAGMVIIESMFTDLGEYDNYIKKDEYYYSKGINSQMTLSGKMFAASGYYTTLNVGWLDTVVVNNDILSDQFKDADKIEEIYSLVLNKQWTMEKLFEYGKDYATGPVEDDLDRDRYTLVVSYNQCSTFFNALGGSEVEKDENDLPVVSINKAMNVERISYLKSKFIDNYATYIAPNDTHGATFEKKNSMFLQSPLHSFPGYRDISGIDARGLPMPVYEEGQDYRSPCVAWTTNLAGIPAITADADKAAYCFESFMALSYDYVYPEFYEKLFKFQYSKDENESRIFDIVSESAVVEISEVYMWSTGNYIRSVITSKEEEVGSAVKKAEDEIGTNIKQFLKNYDLG